MRSFPVYIEPTEGWKVSMQCIPKRVPLNHDGTSCGATARPPRAA